MNAFPAKLALIDVETTGGSASADRMTEIAILLIDDGIVSARWSTLLNPGQPIPPSIQWLTGINDAMVADAPRFSDVAPEIRRQLDGRVFVAHNARFDYGFVKNAFERNDESFSARTLCTVRLSRALYPEQPSHGLDAIVLRHQIHVEARHRALGDAEATWAFIECARAERGEAAVAAAIATLLKTPSLPPKLPPDALTRIPQGPGVYLFFGSNTLPIYIGKSVNLRDRVRSHFSGDHRSDKEARLSRETARIETQRTPGALSAALLESRLIKERFPAHNQQLRRLQSLSAIDLDPETGRTHIVSAQQLDLTRIGHYYGPYRSRSVARTTLNDVAHSAHLCTKTLGLDRGPGPCFGYQIGRCLGACVGEESLADHGARSVEALAPSRIQSWPFDGPIGIEEHDPETGDTRLQIFHHWCWLGEARDAAEALEIARKSANDFDLDTYKILKSSLSKSTRGQRVIALKPLCEIDEQGYPG